MEKNYDEFDYLTIDVKKEKYEKVLKYYNSFGWSHAETLEHDIYGDTVVVTFERKHKQKNKDKLQLLQIRLENKFSELSKCEQYMYAKTSSFGISTMILLILILSAGIYMIVKNLNDFTFFGGIIITIISAILIVLSIVKTVELKRGEDKAYKQKYKKINEEITSLCDQAKKLVGEKTNGQ